MIAGVICLPEPSPAEAANQDCLAAARAHSLNGWESYDKKDYLSAYREALSGIAVYEHCPANHQSTGMGYLLSLKGSSEHYLAIGDSQTDLNQANMLLVTCRTTPRLYGTQVAAACQTQEQQNTRLLER
jgi:hypothetical protein